MDGDVVELFPRDSDGGRRPRRRAPMPDFFQDNLSHRYCDHDLDCPPDMLCDRGRCV